jgi:zinc transport system substrate-binding protein
MRLVLALAALLASTSLATAQVKVIASIKPIHSLVASVMQGVGMPDLIVSGSNSPHTYSLKPSDAEALQNAEVIFWVGPELEAFLQKPLEALGQNAVQVSLLRAADVKTLPARQGNGFDVDEDESGLDGHIWLDPENAKAMLKAIASTLSTVDKANAATYKSNAEKAAASLDALSADIAVMLAPVKGKGFIVFHDAYHYFENRFGVKASGAISINPENPPGAQAVAALQKRVSDGKIRCVFAEPQFDNKLVALVIEGSNVKSATLDPEGANIEPGPELYETVLHNMAMSLQQCLQQ